MPELTAERRKEYVKLVRTKGEDAKVHVRGIRRKAKDELDGLLENAATISGKAWLASRQFRMTEPHVEAKG